MSGKWRTNVSTAGYSAQIDALQQALGEADAVVIGAGAGLSASAGFTYDGERYHRYFADFEEKYGFGDMYSGGFYPYGTPEEYWAYWSRYVFINRYTDAPKPVYSDLFSLVKDKDYFVLTTNVDHCFQKAGFDKNRLFYTQGDYGLFQCRKPCCHETWDNDMAIRQMVALQKNMRIPSDLVPVCPHCGGPVAMNLRADDRFVEDAGWHRAAKRYAEFLRAKRRVKVLFLELGVGYNTPGIIKYPFWRMTEQNSLAIYASVNRGEAVCPDRIAERALCINEDVGQVLRDCAAGKQDAGFFGHEEDFCKKTIAMENDP